jgi:glycosyltransferase involved in cell wall biosynthesis
MPRAMPRDPKIAYVLLRNAHFGPRLASSVELCVRDLVRNSRYAGSTVVVCPPVDEPFEGIAIEAVPRVSFGGNLAKAWAVGRLLKRGDFDLILVENHLPAAAFIASASGVPVILHSHAYERATPGRLKRAERDAELARIGGFAFVSEDCRSRFRANFPRASAPMRAVPNGLDMAAWSGHAPKSKVILSVGRALADKGHLEAMGAIARALGARPDWSARFILSATDREPQIVQALRGAAAPFKGRIRIDETVPYAEVQAAWESASIGMVLTKTPEPFGRTALEALASGAALVTSGFGGLSEVCGPHALKVDPASAEGVEAALASLMDSASLREQFAQAGRARVEALFDIRIVARRMDDFIDEVLSRRSAGRGEAPGEQPQTG